MKNFFKNINSSFSLAYFDIKSRFSGSILGPFWILINVLILSSSVATIYSQLLNVSFVEYFTYVSLGFATWWMIVNTINESTEVIINNRLLILNSNFSLHLIWLRLLLRNTLIFFHTLAIYFIFIIIDSVNFKTLYLFPIGLIMLMIFLYFVVIIVSVLCIKNRDLKQLITSIMGVLTFITPIIFMIELFPGRAKIITFNPFFHLLEIIRDPLLGNAPVLLNYIVTLAMILFLFLIIYRYFTLNKIRKLYTWL